MAELFWREKKLYRTDCMRFSPATFFVICKSRKTHKEVAWKPWAPPVMASTATSGLPVPVPIDGAL